MALGQAAFRFGIDELLEATHGWHAAQNVNISFEPNKPFLLRFLCQASGGVAHSNVDWRFQYNKNGAGWNNITTTSAVVKAVATGAFVDLAPCTNRLTGGTGTFETTADGCSETGGAGGVNCDIVANGFTETECALEIVSADVIDGDTIQFRLLQEAAVMTSYAVTPTLTVAANSAMGLENLVLRLEPAWRGYYQPRQRWLPAVAVGAQATNSSASGQMNPAAVASAKRTANSAGLASVGLESVSGSSTKKAVTTAAAAASGDALTGPVSKASTSAAQGSSQTQAAAAVAPPVELEVELPPHLEELVLRFEPVWRSYYQPRQLWLPAKAVTQATSSAAAAKLAQSATAAPSIKLSAGSVIGNLVARAPPGASVKRAAAVVLGKATSSSVTGAVTKAVTRTAQGAARTWAQGIASAVQTTSSSAAGSLLATATATDSTGRSALAAAAGRSGGLASDTTGRVTIGSGAARSGALAADTTGRLTAAVAASTGKAQAGPSLAKHISAASSGQLRAKAAVLSTTTRSTAVARGSAKTSVEQPIFLGARGTLHLSAVAANIAVARRASAIAAAPTTSVATDTTRRSSATAVGAAASRATAPQASIRRSAAVGSVRSGATVASSSNRSTLARGAARTSAALPTFLSIKIGLRQSAMATNLATSRQAAGVAATKIVATALDTTARASQASGAATTKAIAAQGNARQSVAVGRVRSSATVICTTLRITALAKGAAKVNAVQPRFPSVKSAGKQSAVAAGTAQRIATATAAHASRATVASGQATRTAPTIYVIAGTDVVATPGSSHRATAVAIGSATTGGSISSGAAARRSAVAAATLRFSVIGIQIPPEVIWLRGRRESTQLRGKYGDDSLRGRWDSTQLRGKYGNGSLHGQSVVIALRGRR